MLPRIKRRGKGMLLKEIDTKKLEDEEYEENQTRPNAREE
jgi:hypothetical protein